MGYIDFYHYTSKTGKKAIEREKVIRASTEGGRDANYGPGVYGTSLTPAEGRKKIAANNWDDNAILGLLRRAAFAFKIRVLESDVKRPQSNRDILLYTPGDLDLDDHQYEIIEVNLP